MVDFFISSNYAFFTCVAAGPLGPSATSKVTASPSRNSSYWISTSSLAWKKRSFFNYSLHFFFMLLSWECFLNMLGEGFRRFYIYVEYRKAQILEFTFALYIGSNIFGGKISSLLEIILSHFLWSMEKSFH